MGRPVIWHLGCGFGYKYKAYEQAYFRVEGLWLQEAWMQNKFVLFRCARIGRHVYCREDLQLYHIAHAKFGLLGVSYGFAKALHVSWLFTVK